MKKSLNQYVILKQVALVEFTTDCNYNSSEVLIVIHEISCISQNDIFHEFTEDTNWNAFTNSKSSCTDVILHRTTIL
jgi:predicted nucleotidyltransferase